MICQPSDFKGEISIPNPAKELESIQAFINKYEPKCLEEILGYPLYKEYLLNPSSQRFMDLIYGKEYTNYSGKSKKWQGFIYSNVPVTPTVKITGYTQKPSQQIDTGVTPGIIAGQNGFTFDGTSGKPDWRGESIIIDRAEFGVMFEGKDYSFNPVTGTFLLLKENDVIAPDSLFNVIFNPKPIVEVGTSDNVTYFNNLANAIYWYIMQDRAVWNSGVGTAVPNKKDAVDISPVLKMNRAWNEFSSFVWLLDDYLSSNSETYPEYDGYNSVFSYRVNEFDI